MHISLSCACSIQNIFCSNTPEAHLYLIDTVDNSMDVETQGDRMNTTSNDVLPEVSSFKLTYYNFDRVDI